MSKKISSLILAFMMAFSVCTAFAVQVDWTDDERIAMLLGETFKQEAVEQVDIVQDLLYHLGIISDPSTLNKDAKLNAGDFLKAIAEISGAASSTDTELMYRQLKQGGYVNLSSSKSNVTMDNALFSAVALTNRTREAEARGGYPYGYYLVASQSGLLTNLKYNAKGKMTVAEALQLYYNIISVDKGMLSEVADSGAYYSDKNFTSILEEKYNVTLKKGLLTAANLTGMYGPSSLAEDEIEIDRVAYDYAGDMAAVCVGARVAAFVQKETGDERGTVLCFEPYKTQITEFRAVDVEEYDDTSITLENEEEISLDNPRVIFNGAYYGFLEDKLEQFLEMDAQFTAIDNNNDDSVEVLNIVGYEHVVAEFDVGSSETVSFKHGATFNGKRSIELFSDSDCYVEIVKNGKSIQPQEIKSNNVLSLAMSGNKSGKKYLKVKVSDAQVSGIVEESFVDGAVQHLTVEKNSYRYIAKRTDIEPEVGKSYTFFLSESGDIVDLTESSTGLKWAFLVKYDAEKGLNEGGTLKLFTQDAKMLMFDFAEQAKYYDEANLNGVKLSGKEIVEKLSRGSISRVPVRYMLNTNGEISSLYVPIDNTDGHMEPGSYPCLYSKNVTNGRYYNFKFLIAGNNYFLDKGAFVFKVPSADNDRDELYRLEDLTSNESHTVQLYNADKFGVCPVAVSLAEAQSMDDQKMPRIVEKVVRGVNSKGDYILKVYTQNANGIVDAGQAAKSVIEIEDEDMLSYDNDRGWVKNVKAKDLKFGDVIGCDIDSTGRLERFKLFFRASDPGQFRMQDYQGSRVMDGSENIDSIGEYFAYANLEELGTSGSATYVRYNVGTEEKPIYYSNQIQSIFGTGVTYRIDMKSKKVTKISISDFKPDDKVIVYRSWGGINMMALID